MEGNSNINLVQKQIILLFDDRESHKAVVSQWISLFDRLQNQIKIYIKFNTATKSPTPSGVGLFVLRADSNNQMQGSGGALLAASSMAVTP